MGGGVAGNTGEPLTNSVMRNNILHVWTAGAYSVYNAGGTTDDADYDLRNGNVNISGAETHGFVGTPIYASGHGWQSEAGGNYQLSSSSACPCLPRFVRGPPPQEPRPGSSVGQMGDSARATFARIGLVELLEEIGNDPRLMIDLQECEARAGTCGRERLARAGTPEVPLTV
jgi:hypothetical protein